MLSLLKNLWNKMMFIIPKKITELAILASFACQIKKILSEIRAKQ